MFPKSERQVRVEVQEEVPAIVLSPPHGLQRVGIPAIRSAARVEAAQADWTTMHKATGRPPLGLSRPTLKSWQPAARVEEAQVASTGMHKATVMPTLGKR